MYPYNCTSNKTLALATLTSWASVGIPTGVTVNTEEIVDTTFPFPDSEPRQVRLVACGMRARYIGAELNRAGVIMPFAPAGYLDVVAGLTDTEVHNTSNTKTYPITRAWQGCTVRPSDSFQTSYQIQNSSMPNVTSGNASMAIVVTGCEVGAPFEFEIVRFFEALPYSQGGSNHQVPSRTISDSDMVGLSTVRQFLGAISASEVGQGLWNRGVKFLTQSVAGAVASYAGVPMITYPSVVEL